MGLATPPSPLSLVPLPLLSFSWMHRYTKPKGQVPDYDEPVILRKDNPTVEDFCNKIHRGIMRDFK